MQWYRQAPAAALNKEMDWDSDTWRFTLHSSAYTPDLDVHKYVSSLTGELATGGGYTAGGFAVTVSAPTYTTANTWSAVRANSTAYVAGDVVRPAATNGLVYVCVVAGTTAAAAPTFPTVVGREVTDGTVVWSCVGGGITVLGASTITQTGFTAGPFRYGVLSDRTPATAAAQPLAGLVDFGSNQTGTGGTFSMNFGTAGALNLLAQ